MCCINVDICMLGYISMNGCKLYAFDIIIHGTWHEVRFDLGFMLVFIIHVT